MLMSRAKRLFMAPHHLYAPLDHNPFRRAKPEDAQKKPLNHPKRAQVDRINLHPCPEHRHNIMRIRFLALAFLTFQIFQCRAQLTCDHLRTGFRNQGCCEKPGYAVLPPEIDISGYGRCSGNEIRVTKAWTWNQYPSTVMTERATPDEYGFFVNRNLALWAEGHRDEIFSTTVESVVSSETSVIIKLTDSIPHESSVEQTTTCHFTLDGSATGDSADTGDDGVPCQTLQTAARMAITSSSFIDLKFWKGSELKEQKEYQSYYLKLVDDDEDFGYVVSCKNLHEMPYWKADRNTFSL